ncbi:ras-related protein Rab-23-like [Tigriopus californicus]|nr:ras-related protein Rab-23-like [Tigriopus californicus]
MFIDDWEEEDYEIAIKVVVVGNGGVGKSSMIQRYCKGTFTKKYKKTIGVDFLEKQITTSGEDLRLMLWDTAGQEEFDAITKAYYRGAQACVIAFSTTDKPSFNAVKKWKRKVEDECGHIPMVLVQNKIDLLSESQVDNNEIEKFSRNTGIRLFRISVKDNLNVSKVFNNLAERHIEAVSRWSDEFEQSSQNIGLDFPNSRDVKVRFSSSTENLQSIGNAQEAGGSHMILANKCLSTQNWYFPQLTESRHSGYIVPIQSAGSKAKSRKCHALKNKSNPLQRVDGGDKTIILTSPFRHRRQTNASSREPYFDQQQYQTATDNSYKFAKQSVPVKLSCGIL